MGNLNTGKEEEINGQENNYRNKMAISKKKKKFFDVEIPILKKLTQLYAYNIEELEGRIIKYDLTRFLRGKNALFISKVKIIKDQATSIPKEFIILQTFIRKIVRKGTNYVEDSFLAQCKDAQLKIKPFLVTRRKVSRAVRKALRNKAREEIIEYVKDKTSETIFKDLLKNQLQKPLSLKLKKIYPLSVCEIRVLKVEKDESNQEKKVENQKPEEKKPDEKTEDKK